MLTFFNIFVEKVLTSRNNMLQYRQLFFGRRPRSKMRMDITEKLGHAGITGGMLAAMSSHNGYAEIVSLAIQAIGLLMVFLKYKQSQKQKKD